MSNRHYVLGILQRLTVASYAEICDAATTMDKTKVRHTLGDLKKAGMVRTEKDVTGDVAYRLTPAGKAALEAGPQPGKKHGATHDTQPAVVRNTGNQASATDAPPVEGLVVESPQSTGNTAAADSHVGPEAGQELTDARRERDQLWLQAHRACEALGQIFYALELPIDAAFDDPDTMDFVLEQIAAMKRDSTTLDNILSANREFCDWVGRTFQVDGREPVNLYECQQQLVDYYEHKLSEYAGELADREIEIHELEIDLNAASTVGPVVDMVNSPPHYQGKVECIDAIESALGPVGFHAYCRGNALEYAFRAGRKGDAATDLAKAAWYLARIAP